jgi:hypothetical protein
MALGTSVTVTVAAFELDDCAAISHRDAGTSDSWASER